jgi:hypothetical protein
LTPDPGEEAAVDMVKRAIDEALPDVIGLGPIDEAFVIGHLLAGSAYEATPTYPKAAGTKVTRLQRAVDKP